MQMTMTLTIFNEVKNDLNNTNEVDTSKFFIIVVVRLMCAIALHMVIKGEVHQSIQMLKFAIYRTPRNSQRIYQILVALMQFSGAISS